MRGIHERNILSEQIRGHLFTVLSGGDANRMRALLTGLQQEYGRLPELAAVARLAGRMSGAVAGSGEPVLSVVIPTCNRLPVLRTCLQHLECQTLPAPLFEVLVIDDASTDGTDDFLPTYDAPFAVRHWRQTHRGGPGAARNVGIRAARGEFVVFLNDDALLMPDGLLRHAFAHCMAGQPISVLGKFELPKRLRQTLWGRVLDSSDLVFEYVSMQAGALYNGYHYYTCNISTPRQALLDVGLFDERFCGTYWGAEDIELGLRLDACTPPLRTRYEPSCRAVHEHDLTVQDFARMFRVRGGGAVRMFVRHGQSTHYSGLTPANVAFWRDLPAAVRAGMDTLHAVLSEAEQVQVPDTCKLPILCAAIAPEVQRLGLGLWSVQERDLVQVIARLTADARQILAAVHEGTLHEPAAVVALYPMCLFLRWFHDTEGVCAVEDIEAFMAHASVQRTMQAGGSAQVPLPPVAGMPVRHQAQTVAPLTTDPDEMPPRFLARERLWPMTRHVVRDDMAGALEAAEQLCRMHPERHFYMQEYAVLLAHLGQHEQAQTLCHRILERNPYHVGALRLRGQLLMQQGDIPGALGVFADLLGVQPGDTAAVVNMHTLRRQLRQGRPTPPTQPGQAGQAGLADVVHDTAIVTSLPPGEGAVRALPVIASWLGKGFEVWSVNTCAEYEQLAPLFPGVRFWLEPHTGKAAYGKDFQFLDTALACLAQTGKPVCGIVNADILLRGTREQWSALLCNAREGLVFGSRLNVHQYEASCGWMYDAGYDYFFFPRAFAQTVPSTVFALGVPWWDMFLPMWAQRSGLSLRFCYEPFALHLYHPMKWDFAGYYELGLYALGLLAPELGSTLAADPGKALYARRLISSLSFAFKRQLKSSAQAVFCDVAPHRMYLVPPDPWQWTREEYETLIAWQGYVNA